MIREIIEFDVIGYGTPSDEDLQKCIDIQKKNPDKKVILNYMVVWSGQYRVYFMDIEGNIFDTIEEVRSTMPRYYAV